MLPHALLIAFALFPLGPEPDAAGGPESAAGAAASVPEGGRFASRTLAAIDCVLRHHIDPPTRQQLVLQAVRVLAREAGDPHPIGLGRRVSELTSQEDMRQLLAEHWTAARTHSLHAREELENLVLDGILASAPGPGRVVPAREHTVERQLAANRYVGIGIALAMANDVPRMAQIFEGGPADQAGARTGDLILQVDGVEMPGKPLTEVVDLLRGPAGSEVTLVLQQADEEDQRTCTMTRGEVPIKTVSHQRIVEGEDPLIGYIRIERIAASTVHELRQLEPALRDAGVIVLDLRYLQATELHPAVLLAEALLDGGTIGAVRRPTGVITFSATRDCLFRDQPLIAFVNRHTTGTVEWLAAALQDGRKATIAGEPTAGQAYVAESVKLPDRDDVLVLATGILERADGQALIRPPDQAAIISVHLERAVADSVGAVRSADAWSVQPDVHVPDLIRPGTTDSRVIVRAVKTVQSKLREAHSKPE